jgi:protein-L-isoaspartate(D-aspartate) O-methyltransferase
MSDAARQALIARLRRGGVADEKVLTAVAAVPRDRFVPASISERAWDNTALPIGYGQTISQPQVVAAMTEALALGSRMKVLEIGTGSGYQTAVLAKLCRRVYTIERWRALAREAEKRLLDLGVYNVVYHVGDGTRGWAPQAPFDRIVVTAGAEDVPRAYLDQLAVGGVLVIPVGADASSQTVERIVRTEDGYTRESLMPVRFVPLVEGPLPDA